VYCLHHQGDEKTASSFDRRPFPHWSAQLTLGTTDSYISSETSAHGLFITLVMETVRTSETSVYSNETARRYPEVYYLSELD
jgi:hypothetical protein